MVLLIHEIWLYPYDDDGEELPMCVLAGLHEGPPEPEARVLCSFRAGSHFEAMTIYHEILDREPYSTVHSWDYEPYPADHLDALREWKASQRST